MALKISLKPGERFVVNGAVIANGERRSTFVISNKVSILRERDIMTEGEVTTPARRVYWPIMLSYLDADHAHQYYQSFVEAIVAKNYEIAHPGAVALRAQTPQELVAELATREAAIETVIHNDVHPNTPLPIEQIPLN